MKLKSIDELQGSETFRRLNADLFNTVAPRPPQSPQPRGRREGEDRGMERPTPRVGYRVTLVQCRRKLLDAHDSMRFAVKPTVDFITAWLGFPSDDDPRLQWCYEQHKTRGQEGVLVHIEVI